uniref:Programmed cell death protein 2 n=1 Tax=Phallusia mammillata TaxID=59560 RepID=A0A6F9DP12_9ASCI|nr:programmed cell death protein 2 [Phallusia mammillata]
MSEESVDLGFLETPEHEWRLHRCYFPSKVGGKPAWLDPKNLPTTKMLECKNCCKPMIFLLQLYAPVDEHEHCFHRSIVVFCCKNGNCYSQQEHQTVQAFSCTLPRNNLFYPFDPPDYESGKAAQSCTNPKKLCNLCGAAGNKTCAKCKAVNYCGRDHQVLDWKNHKPVCGQETNLDDKENDNTILFPEKEIVIESEEELGNSEELQQNDGKCNGHVSQSSSSTSYSATELEEAVGKQSEDKTFTKFKWKIANYPDQVVRFHPGGKPLWCSAKGQIKSDDVPNCPCGAKRKFEFQIMPQLLSYLNVESTIDQATIDWATVAVYACSQNCQPVTDDLCAYIPCFAWRQNFLI